MSTAQLLTSRKAPAGAAAPPRRRGDTERPAYEWAGRECLRTARPAPPATSTSEAAASADDVVSQVGWRSVRARVLAQRGDVEQAESLAREAVALADATDGPEIQAGARVALAHVLQGSGNPDERAQLLEEACELYEKKENTVLAERTRSLLEPESSEAR
jgi:uncharacterized protein HemY